MGARGRRLRAAFVLAALGALAVLLAGASGGGRLGVRETDGGEVPAAPVGLADASPGAYFRALREGRMLRSASLPALSWTSRGPRGLGGSGPTGHAPWSGRGTAIAVAPTNDRIAYLGTADGGVWKTTDDGVHWTPVFDHEPTQSIGAVAVDPTNPNLVYVGTGEANWALQGQEILLGDGIYRSTDGGSTWARSAIPFASGYMGGGCGVSSLAVDPAARNVLVAGVFCPGTTDSGATAIVRSSDSGVTWSAVGPKVGAAEDEPPSVTVDPARPSTWLATISATGGSAGVWRSTDSGATWTKTLAVVPGAEGSAWSAPRGVVAVAPSDGNRVYALFDTTYACTGAGCLNCAAGACNTTTAPAQLWTSADAGGHWTELTNTDAYGHTNAYALCVYACWSTLTMAVSPSDPATVYVGTIFPYKLTNYGADLVQVQASVDATPSVHADEHAMEFDHGGRLWVANDGGVDRYDSQATMLDTAPDSLNATLPTIQAYRLSVGSNGDIGLATQDNGCVLYTPTGGWQEIGCGDAAFVVVSALDPSLVYKAIQYMSWIDKSTDGGQTWGGPDSTPWATLYGGSTDPVTGNQIPGPQCQANSCTPFLNPFVEDPQSGDLYTASDNQVWKVTPDRGDWFAGWAAISPRLPWFPGAIGVAPSNERYVYAGSSAYSDVSASQIEVTHDGGSTWHLASGCCGYAPVTDIEVDPSNPAHAYATTSSWPPQQPRAGISGNGGASALYETSDGGLHWTTVGASLPAAPFNAIAVDWSFGEHTIYVATDVGVFWSEDDGTVWNASSSGLPAVSVQDLAVSAGKLYAATFGRGVYSAPLVSTVMRTLTAATAGAGSGTVASSPGGISCGSTCVANFSDGTSVTLTASADTGSSFAGWSGACSGTAATCTLPLTTDRSATATFVPDETLTVTKAGSGSGTVSSGPAGISCGSTCTHAFAQGTSVVLTAAAAAGSTFTGWSGDCSGTAATCTLSMSGGHSATATFERNPTLTVTRRGTGQGTVTSSPAGIACGTSCSHAFAYGVSVTLTAAAAAGSTFGGWSGDCSGTVPTCTLPLTSAHSAAATFTALCVVPKLVGRKLAVAKRALRAAHCAPGKVTKKRSPKKKGTVVGQKPAPGTQLAAGSKVALAVSKGRRRHRH